MNTTKYIIIDFDRTFLKAEAFEELAKVITQGLPQQKDILKAIYAIGTQEYKGEISVKEAIRQRIALLKPTKGHLAMLINRLKGLVTLSISRNKDFFQQFQNQIFIVSHHFRTVVEAVVADYFVMPAHVLANDAQFDADGNITGIDEANPLAESNGKVQVLQRLGLEGEIFVIGDAYTDYQVKAAGVAHKFFAFTENIERSEVMDKADHITPSFDEFLYVNKFPMAISYPKSRIKVLLLENIHPNAVDSFTKEGYQVKEIGRALSEDELCEQIKDVSILGIRSKTRVTPKVLEHANRLLVASAFCIGTNQINLEACAKKGVITFNAPFSNTRSVVELALGEIIMLMRRIPAMSGWMKDGTWNKSAKKSYEIRGKKLGIVGYGNIGAQLSVLAEAAGMDVYYYDLEEKLALSNATKCESLNELLGMVDAVTLHVDGRADNRMAFGKAEFDAMKDGAVFLNLSRGFVVDIDALVEALDSGKLLGAAVDVFPDEPRKKQSLFRTKLQQFDNIILTPHVGGSTEEAQQHIGRYVPSRIIAYVNTGNTSGSVNFPNLQLPALQNAHRLIHIHRNVPGILAKINNILAAHEINIVGQYLKTNNDIGYVITDIASKYTEALLSELKKIEHTIKFRTLY